uniref:TBC1 domain family member 2B n=1 Tax=Meloidogyne incognita TaxID=6306 RepID=A0A914LPL2_MELIC
MIALSLLSTRKHLYFGLEELNNKLIYYKTKGDFDTRKDCQGQISLNGAFCSLIEGNMRGFILYTETGKKYLFEAENERAADCWLNALQQRRDDCNDKNGIFVDSLPLASIERQRRRHRSRSKSFDQSNNKNNNELTEKLKQQQQKRSATLDGEDNLFERGRTRTLQQTKDKTTPIDLLLETTTLAEAIITSSPVNSPQATTKLENNGVTINGVNENKNSWWKWPTRSSTQQIKNKEEKILSDVILNENNKKKSDEQKWLVDYWLKNQQQQQEKNEEINLNTENKLINELIDIPPLPNILCNGNGIHSTTESIKSNSSTSLGATTNESIKKSIVEENKEENELLILRELSNRQKEQIVELREQLQKAQKLIDENGSVGLAASEFIAKSRFLRSELERINEHRAEANKQIETFRKCLSQSEAEMEEFKREYIHLLQSCVHIPLRDNSACDIVEVKLYGGDEHERRVRKLLEKARQMDPTLPTFEAVLNKNGNEGGEATFHVDGYGFRHSFNEAPLALHFIATQLHAHYQSQSADYVNLKANWRALLNANPDKIEKNRQTRHLCRLGIPRSLRSRVWRLLIDQQVSDLKAHYGTYYFRELCSSQGTPNEKNFSATHQKQVNLDLLRTMPNNVHFMSASCKGVTHLQTVLRAYCLHNPTIGYCQGMNFLVATALLFMSPEDAFWFIVAITERYFDSSYFDQTLTGAQADQEVLKEIVEQKFPQLAEHLDECEIDLTTAIPFQTMLRIWDTFLLEGPKVLFRYTIALLGLYQEEILAHTDTISVIKVLKAGVRLTLDVDGLIKYAFEDLNPFPSKIYLRQRQHLYLQVLHERLNKRQQLRQLYNDGYNNRNSSSCNNILFNNAIIASSSSDQLADLPIEVIVFSPFVEGCAYVCSGNQKRGKLSVVQLCEKNVHLNALDLEFDCRPISMAIFAPEMAFVSLLSGYIVALHLINYNQSNEENFEKNEAEILWELKLNDVALKLVHDSHRLYACLANGTLTVLENAFERMPSALDLYHIPVAAAPITDALLDGEFLYLAIANKIVILNRYTLSTITSVYVASAAAGSQVPMFEKIRALAMSPHGIWLVTAHSSLLQLWQNGQCEMLFDIRYDHSNRTPSFDEHDDLLDQVEVCSILFHSEEVWVGTIDGYLMLYKVNLNENNEGTKLSTTRFRSSIRRYQPGKRLSAVHGLAQQLPVNGRQQTYYIPTENEKRVEERNSSMECMSMEGQFSRKISVKIDKHTRKYSINVLTLKENIELTSPPPITEPCKLIKGDSSSNCSETHQKVTKKFSFPVKKPLCGQQSVDSALTSILTKKDSSSNSTPTRRRSKLFEPLQQKQQKFLFDDIPSSNEAANSSNEEGEEEEQEELVEEVSLKGEEKDEEEYRRKQQFARLIQINNTWRKMSASFCASTALPKQSSSSIDKRRYSCTSSTSTNTNGVNIQERALRIRRKDLDFEEPPTVLLAVKEGEQLPTTLNRQNSLSKFIQNTNITQKIGSPPGSTATTTMLDTTEIKSSLLMTLQMKLKVADKPIRCIALGSDNNGRDVVLTGAGEYGDEEALLRWRRDPNNALWINDPLVDIGAQGRRRNGIPSPTSNN